MALHVGQHGDVIFQRPKDGGRGRPLAAHRGPYGDVILLSGIMVKSLRYPHQHVTC